MEDDQAIEGQLEEPVNDEPAEAVPTPEDESELGDEVSERTRREFEKLRETNRILSEKARKAEKYEAQNALEDVFGSVGATKPQPQQSQAISSDFIDEQGNVDVRGLNEALARANYTAQQAAEIARQAAERAEAQNREYQVRETHTKHPWLDPKSDQFDEDSYNLVSDRLARLWAEGKDVRFIDVADEINAKYRKPVVQEEEPVVSTKKAQASSVPKGRGQARTPKVDVAELKARAARGDTDAVDALIKLATE